MAAAKAKKLIVNRTLQFKDNKGKSVTVTPDDQPQPLPGDIAKEALERGWATEPKAAPKAAAKTTTTKVDESGDSEGAEGLEGSESIESGTEG